MADPWKRKEVIGDQTLYLGDWKPRINHQDQKWMDEITFDPAMIAGKGAQATLWGAEYLSPMLPPTKAWLTWVKRPIVGFDFSSDSRSYATTELAWTTVGKSAFFPLVWDGGLRAGDASNRTFCHPSQKPLELMEWCIRRHKDATTILDPFMGSGTTLVACAKLGRKGIGIELDEAYFDIACRRVEEAYKQPDLFIEPPKKPEQEAMDL